MIFDFDKEIDRYNTSSYKWDEAERMFGEKGVLPMWTADMDFRSPTFIIDAIKRRAEHGIFGYTVKTESYNEAVAGWMKRRHNWNIEKDWICFSPGIAPALSFIVQAFTQPGDKIVIQPPVYYPFSQVVEKNECELVCNPLKFENGKYVMDFDDLRTKLDSQVKLLILCSPHNPGGRVWTKEELIELGEICLEHKVLVVSDEIHFDLIYKDHTHIPFASLSEEFTQNTIVCTAPTKTFNLAGLLTSNIIIPNRHLRETFVETMNKNFLVFMNSFGVAATENAYKYGDEWLDQCIDYLQQNLDFLTNFIESNIKELKVIKPEATYLVWIDCCELGMDDKSLEQFMLKEAKVAPSLGYGFGPGGEGFIRINIGCPRSVLEEGLKRIEKAVNSYTVLKP
ncbi:MalY/PatB family protein [Peribacillus sp. FSL E2-0159]|uniref:MalY/PatB family protein n=1 Tax=Peribacillus sp. FSL E2-0159 TaxID=2975289 RepID=UPI00315A4A4A